MSYPMTYSRVVMRNRLYGADTYVLGTAVERRQEHVRGLVADDLRQLEVDQRDAHHLAEYARRAGITETQADAMLNLFLEGDF